MFEDLPPHLHLIELQSYLEFNYLVQHAKAVITNSGGITVETRVLGVLCLTLRDTTERPETVSFGTNALIGADPAKLAPALERLFAGEWQQGGIQEFWDGRAGERRRRPGEGFGKRSPLLGGSFPRRSGPGDAELCRIGIVILFR